jgi:arabinan endo-1,5-alpha-L-arabinosidase
MITIICIIQGITVAGENAHYAVMVARANNALGPFERLGEANGTGSSVILSQSDRWLAPGHNSVITDDAGIDWMLYHAIDKQNAALNFDTHGRRVMMLDKIVYVDGWPRIVGDQPSEGPVAAPVIKEK